MCTIVLRSASIWLRKCVKNVALLLRRRAFLPPLSERHATTPHSKISTAQYFYHSWGSKMKYVRISAVWDLRSRFEFALLCTFYGKLELHNFPGIKASLSRNYNRNSVTAGFIRFLRWLLEEIWSLFWCPLYSWWVFIGEICQFVTSKQGIKSKLWSLLVHRRQLLCAIRRAMRSEDW